MLRAVVRRVKKYPKTSIFVTGLSLTIGYYVKQKYSENLLRHRICSQLKDLGMKKLTASEKLQRVTVFLNPFAQQRGILDKFDANAMPLLQISGLDVQMVYLDDDDEARKYADLLDPTSTDAVIVAGDDNLLAKTLTGLLRREDYLTTELWSTPVYVLPLGVFNNFCSNVLKDNNIINWCYRTIMPVLQNRSHRRNVMNIRSLRRNSAEGSNIQDFQTDPSKQEVFAMTGIEWSCWRDVEYGGGGLSSSVTRPANHRPRLVTSPMCSTDITYEYYSPRQFFKRFGAVCRLAWTYLRAPAFCPTQPTAEQLEIATKKRKPVRRACAKKATLLVKPVCPGCKRCWHQKHRLAHPKAVSRTSPKTSWLGALFGLSSYSTSRNNIVASKTQALQSPEYENPDCGLEVSLDVPLASRIVIALDEDNIRVTVSPAPRGLVSFVRQAMGHLTSPAYHSALPATVLTAAGSLKVVAERDQELSLLCSSVILCPSRTDNEFFWIDNDSFEACPIEVSVLKDAVNSFPLAEDPAPACA